jgi:5-methylcytosine-specific restriction protein B
LQDLIQGKSQQAPTFGNEIDDNLYRIREVLKNLKTEDYQDVNPFWHSTIRPFWDDSTEKLDNEQLSDKTLLEYKKAMILYGPPGTSKSYQARKMAEGMIAEALRKNSANISEAISSLQNTLDSHIHVLQMHPNYTYDDFIIGKSIDNGKIVVKPGKMLQIIKGIDTEDKIPHFVILDEINRVDISRVFGELFTAMEASYRDKGVELSMNINDIHEDEIKGLQDKGMIKDGKLYLKVPNNMYFIGTMNMIDFSLEQVDFALRRRFLWRLSTYDAKRLDEIISENIKDNNISESIPDNFSETCTDLNNEIEWENSLGKSYLIGHAFFSEIVDIFKQVKDWGKAKNILWQVSILPTLEAYCGTMDANMQETFLNNCKKAFMPEPK